MIFVASMWDDGLVSDLRLIDILRKLGAKASFAISPSRHKKTRSINDNRGDYGTLVSKYELKEFAEYEICNHTDNHIDLKKASLNTTQSEIINGRKNLEDIFCKKINGFCYPYGVSTECSINILRKENFLYARTTFSSLYFSDNLLLHPNGRWNEIDLDKLNVKNLIFWGHTYEFKTEEDWNRISKIYEILTQNPKFKIVDFKTLIDNFFINKIK